MSAKDIDLKSLRKLVTDVVQAADFHRATFGGTTRGVPSPWVRVVLRSLELRGERHVQFSYFETKKHITKNVALAHVSTPLDELLEIGYAGLHLTTRDEEIDVRITKKGRVLVSRRRAQLSEPSDEPHNRTKDLPLPEGKADRLLEVLGILTTGGSVRPTMRAKFIQINEFLKHLSHALDDAGLRSLGRAVSILDCGCGSSHLTLAAHHYLNEVLGISARVLGVDVNDEVIRKSAAKADRLGAGGLEFACGQIGQVNTPADVVVALHACDTATDDAIAQAVRGEARLLLSVPCCHHALNRSIRAEGPAEVLRPLLRHGILRERAADLVTDAFRALSLRVMGYKTDVVEFASPEHTARNLMIRAVRGATVGDPAFVREYVELRRFWGVTPYIEEALGLPFQRILGSDIVPKESRP